MKHPASAAPLCLFSALLMLAGSRPVAAHDGPDGKITHRRKEVRTQPDPEQEWRDAEVGDLIYKLGRVNTLENSTAAVVFRDDSNVAMRANTLLIIYGHHALRNKQIVATGAGLERGTLRARLGELEANTDQNGKAAVDTPGARTDLEGGNSLLKVDDAGTSRIHNHGDGNTNVTARAGGQTKVDKGMGVKVVKAKRAAKPIPLPPTPTWLQNPAVFLGVSGRISELRGSWGPIDEANSYYIEVAADVDGVDVLSAIEVPKSVENFEVHGLAPGSYHVRVASVDDDQFESIPSVVRSVELLDVGLTGPGGVEPVWPDDGAGGLTPVPVVLPGTVFSLPAGIRCGTTAQTLEVEPVFVEQGTHELYCENDAGERVAAFPVQVPDLAPGLHDSEATAPQGSAVEVVRGRTTTHELVFDTALTLPEQLYLRAPEGVTIESVEPGSEPGTWTIQLLAGPTAASEADIGLSFLPPGDDQADATFAMVSISIVDPPLADSQPEPTKPERHMFEFGIAGGLMLLSPTHGIYHSIDTPHQPFNRPAGEFVLRAGYYPIRWVGVELDGRVIPTRVANDERATAYSMRAQVIAQLPHRVTPFVVAGGEMLGVSSSPAAIGNDTDFGFHAGGGVKFYATKRVALRLGVNGMFHEGLGSKLAAHFESDLGVSVVLGRRSAGRKQ